MQGQEETSGWQNSPLSWGKKTLLKSSLHVLLFTLITLREFLSLRVIKQKFKVHSRHGLNVSSTWIELTREITKLRISKSPLNQNEKFRGFNSDWLLIVEINAGMLLIFQIGHHPIISNYWYAKNSQFIFQRNRDMCLHRCTLAKAN